MSNFNKNPQNLQNPQNFNFNSNQNSSLKNLQNLLKTNPINNSNYNNNLLNNFVENFKEDFSTKKRNRDEKPNSFSDPLESLKNLFGNFKENPNNNFQIPNNFCLNNNINSSNGNLNNKKLMIDIFASF